MKKRAMTKKLPIVAVLVLMAVAAGAVFLWNTVNNKMAKPLNSYLLPGALGLLGIVSFFFKPARKAAGPLLLVGATMGGLEMGRKAAGGLLGRPGASRYRHGQNRPSEGVGRPTEVYSLSRPSEGMAGLETAVHSGPRSAWD